MDWLPLLERLCLASGPPGFEEEVKALIREELEGRVDEIQEDSFGNLYAIKGRGERRFMLAAHMDEVAMMVRHVESSGFLRFTSLGGISPSQLIAQRVVVHGRVKLRGVVGSTPAHMGGEDKVLKLEEMYVDVGARSKEEVQRLGVRLGTPITFDAPFNYQPETGVVMGKALDDRLGCLVLAKAVAEAEPKDKVFAVFTCEEERGLRGAQVAANRVKPKLAFVLEGTIASDVPGVPEYNYITQLGKGPAIRVMDRTVVVRGWLLEYTISRAEELGIPYQLQLSPVSGTDAGPISVSNEGVPVGVISIPARYIHSPQALAKVEDIENTMKLVKSLLEDPPARP
ncbi:MAG: M42 family metallopeptidase [Candidatus Korarchaeum sp.]|nr:M42 family metallopeptidase [Candidatus Korarchaeum sp.]MDW8035119.1 M42 family metallopeptidase [Candidatus Korarchaeum sp.]